MITIVDYGAGNIRAFLNAYKQLNIEAQTARTPDELAVATRIIMPGVGSFDNAMHLLDESGMRGTLDELVLERQVPVLGVCVGMQMFADSSDEGQRPGLGWVPGRVRRLTALDRTGSLQLPHMGWNDVHPIRSNGLFAHLETDAQFYFLHSYYFECERQEHAAAVADYGAEFCCAISASNVFGVQFHPEKSHHFGTRLLMNFAAV